MIIKDKLLNNTKNKTLRLDTDIIKYIVPHHTAGNAPGDFNMLSGRNINSSVSIHYYIGKDGVIWHLLDELIYIARHTGTSNIGPVENTRWGWNLNPISIGIEMENYGDRKDSYTEAQIKALEELTLSLMEKYNIPSKNVIGHKEITTNKIDPSSNFYDGDMDGFRKFLSKGLKIEESEEKKEFDIKLKMIEEYSLKIIKLREELSNYLKGLK